MVQVLSVHEGLDGCYTSFAVSQPMKTSNLQVSIATTECAIYLEVVFNFFVCIDFELELVKVRCQTNSMLILHFMNKV